MPLTTNGSYITVIDEVLAHWAEALLVLPPTKPLIVRLKQNGAGITRANLVTLRGTLETEQNAVQPCRADYFIARGSTNNKKAALLGQFNDFVTLFDAYYQGTDYYELRPYAPVVTAGKDAFCTPLGEAMILWDRLNDGPAQAGITLPLVLGDGTDQGAFASAISGLAFAYAAEQPLSFALKYARARRNGTQNRVHEVLVNYREAAEGRLSEFPELLETLPRITPLPGHTPAKVNASSIFEAPNKSKIVHDASTDLMLERYELRGCMGPDWEEEDAVVIDSHLPNAPREFITTFGLNQPGAQVVFKVYVILTTGNEAGSAAMFVERPVSVPLAA